MKKTKTNIPELRFPGFEGEWEEKKLGDGIKELQAGVSVNSIDTPVCIGECGILKTSAVYNGKFDVAKNKRIIEEDLDKAKISPIPDNIIISRMNTPDLVGECGYVLNPSENIFLPDRLWITSGVNRSLFNVKFINYTLNTPQNKLVIKNKATGTSNSMKNITKQDWLLTTIALPIISEQEKIAKFLEAVDQKIEQLEKMVVLHEKYKKGMMQRIFNQEIRFKSSNGTPFPAWQQKKLGDVVVLTSSKRVFLKDYTKTGVPFYRGKEISDLYRGEFAEDVIYITNEAYNEIKEKYGVPQIGDLLITAVGTLGNIFVIKNNEPFYFKDGNLIWLKQSTLNSTFLAYLLFSNKRAMLESAIGSSQKALTIVNMSKLKLSYPCQEEQEKIARFLSALDEKIEQSMTELKKAINWKKGLMQRLFV